MSRSVPVEVNANGEIRAEPGSVIPPGRALLTWELQDNQETLHLSEQSLAEDWLRPEEDDAWAHLQPAT